MTYHEAVERKIREKLAVFNGRPLDEVREYMQKAVVAVVEEIDALDAEDFANAIHVEADPNDPTRVVVTMHRPWFDLMDDAP